MLCFALVLAALALAPAAQAQQPNIVLIVADDQAWTDFGFMGHEVIRTPHLDRLAAEGTVFPRGYVTAPLCRPSLASIITGRYPHDHGITGNDPPPATARAEMLDLLEQVDTLPQLLGAHGYRSLQTGKWWEGAYQHGGFTKGMTHGDSKRGGRHGDAGLRIGRQTMQPIADFLDRRDEEADVVEGAAAEDTEAAPFFLWYAPFLPHRPHNPPERILKHYRQSDRSPHLARYYAMCEWFDETCGELLELLDDRKLTANTLVVFIVDNGWIQRSAAQGFADRSKRSPYEGGIRTPIIFRWPENIPAGQCDSLVSAIDLVPTILRAAALPVPEGLPGMNLLPACRGQELEREAVFGAAFSHDVVDLKLPARSALSRFVVQGRFKLIQPTDPAAPAELYDVIADPHEQRNRAGSEPARVTDLRSTLDAWWQLAR